MPLTEIVKGDPEPLLVIVRLPLTAPAAVGAKVTDKVAVAEGFKVVGTATPLCENPVPVIVMAEIWTDEVPVLVSVIC